MISGDTCFYEILDPELSAFRDSFPQSNVYFICTTTSADGEKVENHTFYISNSNEVILEGNVSLSISDPDFDSIFIVYHDPQINFSFPYTFEKTHEDDFRAVITSYFTGQAPLVTIQEGTITTTADAYGTVITAAGEFKNAMRIYREEVAENSIPGISFTTPQESHRYTWLAEGENYLALNLDQIIVRDFMDNIISESYAGFYRKRPPAMSVGIGADHSFEVSSKVFPNPALDYCQLMINIKQPQSLEAVILSLDGKPVQSENIGRLSAGNHVHDLNISNLQKGTHIIQIVDKITGARQSIPLTILK